MEEVNLAAQRKEKTWPRKSLHDIIYGIVERGDRLRMYLLQLDLQKLYLKQIDREVEIYNGTISLNQCRFSEICGRHRSSMSEILEYQREQRLAFIRNCVVKFITYLEKVLGRDSSQHLNQSDPSIRQALYGSLVAFSSTNHPSIRPCTLLIKDITREPLIPYTLQPLPGLLLRNSSSLTLPINPYQIFLHPFTHLPTPTKKHFRPYIP